MSLADYIPATTRLSTAFKTFLQEPLFRDLVSTKAFRRLEHVSFLGALQFFWPMKQPRADYALIPACVKADSLGIPADGER